MIDFMGGVLLCARGGVMAAGEQNGNKSDRGASEGQGAPTTPEISPAGKERPIPEPHKHIQVNGCKTPGCENFGVPARTGAVRKGRGSTENYRLSGESSGQSNLRCAACAKFSRVKSNQAIYEEWQRQIGYLEARNPLSCPDISCKNHSILEDQNTTAFRKYGKTRHGSDRWQCRECRKTFSVGKSTLRQRKPHVNMMVFDLLVNKVPVSRIREIVDLSYNAVYDKIDFIHEQCVAFSAARERQFPSLSIPELHLSTDRQDYVVNWGDRKARKTIQLTAVGTADQASGYVFGLVPNFDPDVDPQAVERDRLVCGDLIRPPQMQKYARIWTKADYERSLRASRNPMGEPASRDDLDAREIIQEGQQLPPRGAQVHADYAMHGHYWVLKVLTAGVGKLRFYLDNDQGLLAACIGAFFQRIRDHTAEVIQVDIDKTLTIDQRNQEFSRAKRWFEAERRRLPGATDYEARLALLAERIATIRAESALPERRLQEVWVSYPFPDRAEPVKRLRFVSDQDQYDEIEAAELLLKATLWPIDTVFNRIRRRITYFERPVSSVSRARRLWHIYAPYDPGMVEKMLTIYRVWHNFVWINKKSGRTAAEMIGLANGKVRTQDIIYFKG